jgi:signal transduction histidine kinase
MAADLERLERGLARKQKEVRILKESAWQLNSTLELDGVLSTILESMDHVFGWKHSMVLLYDEPKQVLRVAASRGFDPPGLGAEVQVGQGIIGMVARKKRIIRMGGIGTQLGYVNVVRNRMVEAGMTEQLSEVPKLPGLPRVQSQVAIPLMVKDRLVGVFAVESNELSVFDDEDEALIAALATHAASAIHNATLYRAAEEGRREAARANAELLELNETLEEKVRARTLELERTQTRLIESEKMAALGVLVAGIAHEMNTPLGSLRSASDTLSRAVIKLREAVAGENKAAALLLAVEGSSKVIHDAGARVGEIVRRLRSFARLDEAEKKQADVRAGIEDAIGLVQHELEGITIERDYAELPLITCYPARLNQVFLNVLRNAIQAVGSASERKIVIRARATATGVRVEIEDSGHGIAERDLPRVFDPGFTTRGVGVGVGLGLSIAYQVVKDHGGEIALSSEVGRGTQVWIDLPHRR